MTTTGVVGEVSQLTEQRVNQFEAVFRKHSDPNWGYDELNEYVPNCRDEVAKSGIEKLDGETWKIILVDIPAAMAEGASNPAMFGKALAVVQQWVDSLPKK